MIIIKLNTGFKKRMKKNYELTDVFQNEQIRPRLVKQQTSPIIVKTNKEAEYEFGRIIYTMRIHTARI